MTDAEILAEFRKLRVLVVGDVCLDRWCRYDPSLSEPSRETGIPRTAVVSTEVTPGAAGTVASNVAALGARVSVLGVVGADGFGHELLRALEARQIDGRLLLQAEDIATFTYTKLINWQTGAEDLPRVDFVNTRPLRGELDRELASLLLIAAPDYDVILVSDQAETAAGGVVTPLLREALATVAEVQPETVIWADSRRRTEHFRGVISKCNRQEADEACLRAFGRVEYQELRRATESRLLVVTHGGEGAEIVDAGGSHRVETSRVENPVDICGAGDSFSAGAALTLRVTGDPIAAARFGNRVAAITIMKPGTGTASPVEILKT